MEMIKYLLYEQNAYNTKKFNGHILRNIKTPTVLTIGAYLVDDIIVNTHHMFTISRNNLYLHKHVLILG